MGIKYCSLEEKRISLRLCVDYRQLKKRTIKNAYTLPQISDFLNELCGSRYFMFFDTKSGYYQIELEQEHKEKSAFHVEYLGLYQYNRLPFGLCNAAVIYQRMMEQVLDSLSNTVCYIYMDEVIILGNSFEQLLEIIGQVLKRFHGHNLKISPKKCAFFETEVKYIGHLGLLVTFKRGIDKIWKIAIWPSARSVDEVRSFLCFASYYRLLVCNFSKLAKPLNDLLVGVSSKKFRRKPGRNKFQ